MHQNTTIYRATDRAERFSLKIGIIGSSGFIGSNYCSKLRSVGYDIVCGDIKSDNNYIDIRDMTSCMNWFEEHKPDSVILTAAIIRQQEIYDDPSGGCETNINGSINIINCCLKYNCMLYFSSTVHVYEGLTGHVDEETTLDTNASRHLYTQTKLMIESTIRSYNKLYNLQYVIFRYGVLYGPGSHDDMLINKFISLCGEREPITIYGTGEQKRCFVHIEDLCDGVVSCIENDVSNTVINLCEQDVYTVNELANIINTNKSEIVYQPPRVGDLTSPVVLNNKAIKLIEWLPKYSVEYYIKSTRKNIR